MAGPVVRSVFAVRAGSVRLFLTSASTAVRGSHGPACRMSVIKTQSSGWKAQRRSEGYRGQACQFVPRDARIAWRCGMKSWRKAWTSRPLWSARIAPVAPADLPVDGSSDPVRLFASAGGIRQLMVA